VEGSRHALNRDVALKVLPAAISGDTERRQRFEQEARAASALNHPDIITVYDIGTAAIFLWPTGSSDFDS
jgi:serine/threonine protein kinase